MPSHLTPLKRTLSTAQRALVALVLTLVVVFATATTALAAAPVGAAQTGAVPFGPGAPSSSAPSPHSSFTLGGFPSALGGSGGWFWQNPLPQGNYLSSITCADASIAWAVGSGGTILKTTNGGTDWSQQTSGTRRHLSSITCANASTAWAVGSGGTILKTTDGGDNWSPQTSGTANLLHSITCADASTAWAVGEGGTILKTTNGGTNWSQQTSGTTSSLRSITCADASTAWAVGEYGTILKTTNGGTDWSQQTSGTANHLLSITCANASTAWAVGSDGTILKTTDGGGTPTPTPTPIPTPTPTPTPAPSDTTPPTTTATGADDAWHNTPVTVTFTARDNPGGSGMVGGFAKTEYSLDNGATWTIGTTCTVPAPANHSNDGSHTVLYRSTDAAGNQEVAKSLTIKIDTTAPTTTATGADNLWHNTPVTVTFTARDNPGGSGMIGGEAKTEYSLDNGATWTTGTTCTVLTPANHSNDGLHTVLYRSTDAAGNVEEANSLIVKIDTTGPITSGKTVTGKSGKPITLTYTITDKWSKKATTIVITIKNARGKTVKTIKVKNAPTNTPIRNVKWTRKTRGVYTYAVTAKDEAGNAQRKAGVARITVR